MPRLVEGERLAGLRGGDFLDSVFEEEVGHRGNFLWFAMDGEGGADIVLDFVDPIGEAFAVGVGGESVDDFDTGTQGRFFAEDFDGFALFDDAAAEGIFRLEAADEDDIIGVGDGVFEMVKDASAFTHAAGGDDDHGAWHIVEGHGFFWGANKLHAGKDERVFALGKHFAGFIVVDFAMRGINLCGLAGEGRVDKDFDFARHFSAGLEFVQIVDDLLGAANRKGRDDEFRIVAVDEFEIFFEAKFNVVGRGMILVGVGGFDDEDVGAGRIFVVAQDGLVGLAEVA